MAGSVSKGQFGPNRIGQNSCTCICLSLQLTEVCKL